MHFQERDFITLAHYRCEIASTAHIALQIIGHRVSQSLPSLGGPGGSSRSNRRIVTSRLKDPPAALFLERLWRPGLAAAPIG
jgi:hypothetical protein